MLLDSFKLLLVNKQQVTCIEPVITFSVFGVNSKLGWQTERKLVLMAAEVGHNKSDISTIRWWQRWWWIIWFGWAQRPLQVTSTNQVLSHAWHCFYSLEHCSCISIYGGQNKNHFHSPLNSAPSLNQISVTRERERRSIFLRTRFSEIAKSPSN